MSNGNIHKLMALLIIAAFAIAFPQMAQAAGTASNTQITNSVSVNFQVGGAAQTPVTTSVTFVVDDKVIFTVTSDTGAVVTTYPLANNTQALTFTVTNTGNTTHDFRLSEVLLGGNTFTPTSVTFYQDDGDGLYEPLADCPETGACSSLKQSGGEAYIDELQPDTSVIIHLAIVVSDAIDAANGDTANYSVTAEARQGGGVNAMGAQTQPLAAADLAAVKSANLNTVLLVLADATGNGDADRDGLFTRNSAFGFLIASANVTVTKTMAAYWDPVNLFSGDATAGEPKAIPGAVVTYTVTITNNGPADTTNVVLSDSLDTMITNNRAAFRTTFDNGGAEVCAGTQGIYLVGTGCLDNDTAGAPDDGGDFSGTAANTVTVTIGNLNNGASAVIKYQVVIREAGNT